MNKNLIEWKCITGTKFIGDSNYNIKSGVVDIMKYSYEYCKLDCFIMMKAYENFRFMI